MGMFILIKKQLKLLLSNRLAIFATILVPLVLTYLFSFAENNNSNKIDLYLCNLDNSSYSQELINNIKSHEDINIIETTEDNIKTKVNNNEIPLGFIIDNNFSDSLINESPIGARYIQDYENGDTAILEQIILTEISTLSKVTKDSITISKEVTNSSENISSENITSTLLDNINNSSNITIDDKTSNSTDLLQDKGTVSLIGFLVMFLWFVVAQGFRTLIDEKENNTFTRLLTTPTNYIKYLFSKFIATFIFGAFHVVVILLAGKYILNISISENIVSLSIMFAAYLFLITSLTLIFALFIKNHQSFTISTSILITVTGMLGGCFFSLELAPTYMQTISKITPESWAIQSLKEAIFNNSSFTTQLVPLTIFITLGILSLLFSIICVNFKLGKSIIKIGKTKMERC